MPLYVYTLQATVLLKGNNYVSALAKHSPRIFCKTSPPPDFYGVILTPSAISFWQELTEVHKFSGDPSQNFKSGLWEGKAGVLNYIFSSFFLAPRQRGQGE